MTQQSVTIRAPATSANLGPGFDAIGFAVNLFAKVTIKIGPKSPRRQKPDPMRRMIKAAIKLTYKHAGRQTPPGLIIEVDNEIPVGRGLGASAAARAAGIVGANYLMAEILNEQELLTLGTKLEGHPDNIAPALFGGLQVMALRDDGSVERIEVPLKRGLRCVVFVPNFSIPTHETRDLLPKRLNRNDAVFNSSRAALLVAALATGSWNCLKTATQERLHQVARSKRFPRMFDLFDASYGAGAHGVYLSGSGPVILAFSDSAHAVAIRDALFSTAEKFKIDGQSLILDPCATGATIIPDSA